MMLREINREREMEKEREKWRDTLSKREGE